MKQSVVLNKTVCGFEDQKLILSVVVFFLVGFAIFLFGKRVVFPDTAFDTVNYHFFLGKSGFENFPRMFKSSEFFPLGMHSFNPLLDTANYLVNEMLGYRFGTLLSLLSLIGSFILSIGIVFRVTQSRLTIIAAIFIFPALIVNEGLFQVATYFTDNHYTFLALNYVYILMGIGNEESSKAFVLRLFYLGILGGLLITKLTNVIYIIPLCLATIYLSLPRLEKLLNDEGEKATFFLAIFSFLLPVLILPGIYLFDAFQHTGNPVFPYYNSIFKAIYFPYESWQFNFGPKTLFERIIYPYIALADPIRLGEVKDLFPDVKLLTTFAFTVVASVALFFFKAQLVEKEKALLFVTFVSFFIWQALFGYTRYAIALEIMLGLLLVILVNRLMMLQYRMYALIIILPCFMFSLWKSIDIIKFNKIYDIAWRPLDISYLDWKSRFFSRDMLKKTTSYDALLAKKLVEVDVVVQCVNPSSVYSKTFPELENKPMLNFDKKSNGSMTSNENYINQRDLSALRALGKVGVEALSFAIVLNNTNKGMHSLTICFDALETERKHGRLLSVEEKIVVDNFVGDARQQLLVFLGKYHMPQKD